MSNTAPKYLHVRLEGAFCVVIKKNDGYRVRACTIAHAGHLFAINGELVDYDPGDSFHFELKPDGLVTYKDIPEIDPAFDWSNKTTSNWKDEDRYYFITMDLPCPKQIMQDGTARVMFGDDSRGLMPRDHILVYEVKDFDKVQIISKELGAQDIDGCGVFQLELGLKLGTPSGTVHDHAIMFYNNMVEKLFPDLYNNPKCRLKDIQVSLSPRGLFTTTLECKSGGMIVGFPQ